MLYIFGGFFETLAGILSEIFSSILTPVLTDVFEILVGIVMRLIIEIISGVLYKLLSIILKVIDVLQQMFDILCGVRSISVPANFGGGFVDGRSGNMTVLEAFMGNNSITTIYLKFTLLAAFLAFVFAAFAMFKAAGDLEGRRPVGAVLRDCAKAVGNLMVIPVLIIFAVKLITASLIIIDDAMAKGNALKYDSATDSYSVDGKVDNPSIARIIFLASSMDSAINKQYNANPSFTDSLRWDYYTGKKSYANFEQVKKDFDLDKFDFPVAICGGAMIAWVFIVNLFYFCRRVFELTWLYLIAPLTIAVYPNDGGRLYNEWKGFIPGRIFMALGSILVIRIYTMIIPMFCTKKIEFLSKSAKLYFSGSPIVIDYAILLVLIVFGAYAMFGAQTVTLAIFSEPFTAGMKGGLLSIKNDIQGHLTPGKKGGSVKDPRTQDPEYRPAAWRGGGKPPAQQQNSQQGQ